MPPIAQQFMRWGLKGYGGFTQHMLDFLRQGGGKPLEPEDRKMLNDVVRDLHLVIDADDALLKEKERRSR
jgi:hypothetical protein